MAENNLINDQPELQYQEMKNIANRNPNVKKWAFTGYISPPKEIGDHLSDEALTEIALQALKKVGVSNQNQYRLDIHHSTKQKHIHFLVNRINTQGKCTVKSHDIGKRFGDAVREVCIAKGLRTDVDIGIEKRTEMLKQLVESIKQAHNFEELIKRMNAKGYEVVLSQNEKDGISGMRITKQEDKNSQTEHRKNNSHIFSTTIGKKPLHIIANGNVRGINLDVYSRNEDVMKKAETLRDDSRFTFCFVGRLVGDKGLNELVAAFEQLKKDGVKNIRLLMVGPKEEQLDPLKAETVDMMNGDDDIILCGMQTDVRAYYAASDAFVFPSYREGFPNTVLEAGAMGLPAIVTDINGCNEIITKDVNGVIIPSHSEKALYDAMKYFVENDGKIKEMGVNARRVIETKFEQKMIWAELLKVYKSFD